MPVYHDGKIVGEKRWYNDRLLMFILKHHLPERYGAPKPLTPGGSAPRRASMEEVRDTIVAKLAAIRRHEAPMIAAAEAARRRTLYDRLSTDPAKRSAWELLNERPLETLLDEEEKEQGFDVDSRPALSGGLGEPETG